MDYQKLLFAAAVRDLASALRRTEEGQYDDQWCTGIESESEINSMLAKWRAEHPLTGYVPAALAQIKETAHIIEGLPSD